MTTGGNRVGDIHLLYAYTGQVLDYYLHGGSKIAFQYDVRSTVWLIIEVEVVHDSEW